MHQKTCINIIIYTNWNQIGSNPNANWINADWIHYNVFIQRKSYSNENEWTRTICSNKDEFSQTQSWKKKETEEKMPNDSTHIGGWYHQLNGHEPEQTPRNGGGQGGLVCCSPWGKQRVGDDWETEQQSSNRQNPSTVFEGMMVDSFLEERGVCRKCSSSWSGR